MGEEAANNPGEGQAQPGPAQPGKAAAPSAESLAAEALAAAEKAVSSLGEESGATVPGGPSAAPTPYELKDLHSEAHQAMPAGISLLSDVNLNVKIELGRTRMLVEDVLKLGEGTVVELDKLAGDPVDVFVNDRPVARGEVLVLNDNFCVRINEILAPLTTEPPNGKK